MGEYVSIECLTMSYNNNTELLPQFITIDKKNGSSTKTELMKVFVGVSSFVHKYKLGRK